MFLDGATVENNFRRFIKRIIESETVYYLSNEDGVANSVSNDDEEAVVLLFWSDKAYSNRVRRGFEECYVQNSMGLFSFLYQWLPGMSGDGVLAGPNWNGDLVGREIDPFELREEIEAEMSFEKLKEYEKKYDEVTRST